MLLGLGVTLQGREATEFGNASAYLPYLGNLVTDAMIDFHINFTHSNVSWTPAAIAVWNGGGIRASIGKGDSFTVHAAQTLTDDIDQDQTGSDWIECAV